MQNSEPLTLAVAILLKIGEKHKAAASFSLDSFLDELYNDFDSGNLKLVSPLRGFGHVEFPYQEAENITKQLFHYKLIPDYVFETPDSLFYGIRKRKLDALASQMNFSINFKNL